MPLCLSVVLPGCSLDDVRWSPTAQDTDISKAVSSYRRADATPEPETPPTTPQPPVNLFDKTGALDLSAVDSVWLCFHQTQQVVSLVRRARQMALRKMGESTMGLSRCARHCVTNRATATVQLAGVRVHRGSQLLHCAALHCTALHCRRRAVDQGEIFNKVDHRMMSRDRTVRGHSFVDASSSAPFHRKGPCWRPCLRVKLIRWKRLRM